MNALKTTLRTLTLLCAAGAASLALAACGGGGGSTPSTVPTASPTVTPVSPTPTPAPGTTTTAAGTVVDFTANTPLAGVTVRLGAYTHGAALTTVATTASNGTFKFTAAPGSYLLVIGSNLATDTRTTYHNKITLVAGANNLTQATPTAEPNVTLSAAQTSGHFRLAALSTTEIDCVTGMNAGRAAAGDTALVPDENSFEYARALTAEEVAQNSDTPTPLSNDGYVYGAVGLIASFTGSGFSSCSQYTNSYTFGTTSVPYATATDPVAAWYGAGYDGVNYTNQIFLADPR